MGLRPDTDAIHAALFALAASATVNDLPAFRFTKRRLMLPEDVPEQPALLYEQLSDEWEGAPQKFPKLRMRAHLWIYAQTPTADDDTTPAEILNPLKDAVINAIAPSEGSINQTLGGLVTAVWTESEIEFDEGLADQRGMVRIPVTMLATF